MATELVMRVVRPLANAAARLDRASKRLAGRLGLTKERTPDRLLAPPRWAARKLVGAGAWLDTRARRAYRRLRLWGEP